MRLPPRVVQIFSLCSKNGALALSGHGIQSQNYGAFNRGLKSRASTIFPATAPFIALCIQTLEHVMRRILKPRFCIMRLCGRMRPELLAVLNFKLIIKCIEVPFYRFQDAEENSLLIQADDATAVIVCVTRSAFVKGCFRAEQSQKLRAFVVPLHVSAHVRVFLPAEHAAEVFGEEM